MNYVRLAGAWAVMALAAVYAAAQAGQGGAPEFRVYTSEGKPSSLDGIVDAMAAAQVVFIGETHDNAAAHRAELRLLEGAFARFGPGGGVPRPRPVVLSLEMFERDVQAALDEYLAGLITERHFLAASRPWKNYETDYRPLVEFARARGLPVVAANAPERYVNRVGRLGPESLRHLAGEARRWLAPLPYARSSAAYADKFRRLMGGHAGAAHGNPFSLEAQALRDATMAHSIAEQLRSQEHALVLHITGNFHSEGGLGTPEHLAKYSPQARALVVTILPAGARPAPDAGGLKSLGDFVVLTGADAATP